MPLRVKGRKRTGLSTYRILTAPVGAVMEGKLKRLAANKAQGRGCVCARVCVCLRLYTFIRGDVCAHKLASVYLSLFVVACKALSALFARVGVCLLLWCRPAGPVRAVRHY